MEHSGKTTRLWLCVFLALCFLFRAAAGAELPEPPAGAEQTLPAAEALPDDDRLCIVIMGYRLYPGGSMRAELIGRLRTALEIVRRHPGALVVCTGGPTAANAPSATEADRMAHWLLTNRVDPARILVENRSLTTVQNACFTLELLAKDHPRVTHILIITSDYHMSSSVTRFRTQAAQAGAAVTVLAGDAWVTR